VGDWVWWFVLAFVLLVAELLTGTFYLLMIAIALAGAGVASLFGASLSVQLLIAAALGFGGAILLRRLRFGRLENAQADPLQNMDVGQTVRVDGWTGGRTARASYRGAQWDVELAPGEEPQPGEFVIQSIQANRLVVARRRS
jgi:membrane protein implicated in regulation of membrane protease activity